MAFDTVKSLYSFEKTIGDTAQPFSQDNIFFHELNIHIYDNDVLYGDGTVTAAIAPVGSIIYYDKGNLRDIFFKNRTAGNDGRVVVVASVPELDTQKALRL